MNHLKEFRFKRNLSQKEMANSLNISISFYEKVENGRRNVSMNFAKNFKKVFPDVDFKEVLNIFL